MWLCGGCGWWPAARTEACAVTNGRFGVRPEKVGWGCQDRAAGSGRGHVLKVTVYVSDIALWGRVNAVYARFFGEHRPARTVVPTRELHYGFQVEIDAIAAVAGA